MPHYTEESALWQTFIEAVAGTTLTPRIVLDPGGLNLSLGRYFDRVELIDLSAEFRDGFNFRGKDVILRLSGLGTQKLNRWNADGFLKDQGWFDMACVVTARLTSEVASTPGTAERTVFTGFLRSPQETPLGGSWVLVDQFVRMREMYLTNIDEISTVKINYSAPDDPSAATLDRTKITIADTTKSRIERWEIIFAKHPEDDSLDAYGDPTEWAEGEFYIRGSETGLDGSSSISTLPFTTESGILTIESGAFDSTMVPPRVPEQGDQFRFLTTIILENSSPAAAIKEILSNHSDLEAEYIDTASMDAADAMLSPAKMNWEIHKDYSILKMIEILCRHGLMIAFPNSSGAVQINVFAPQLSLNPVTSDPIPDIDKADDLIDYSPTGRIDLFNCFVFEFVYDWSAGEYLRTYTYPDDAGDKVADDWDGDPLTLAAATSAILNDSAIKHGVERELRISLPGFTQANRSWLRFLGGWYMGKWGDGLEIGRASQMLQGLTVQPGEIYHLDSSHPERDGSVIVLGNQIGLSDAEVTLDLLKADELDDNQWAFVDVSDVDDGKATW